MNRTWQFTTLYKDDGNKVTELKQQIPQKMIGLLLHSTLPKCHCAVKWCHLLLLIHFRFRFSRLRHHRHIVLNPPAKFRSNRTIRNIVMTSCPFPKMATTVLQFYIRRFRFFGLRSFVKVDIYLQTKCRRDISNNGWDTTTSRFWKQTAAMLEFQLRFRFSRLHHRRHVILHLPTKFRQSQRHSYDVIFVLQDGGHGITILIPVSFFVSSLIWESRSLPANQISARYLYPGWYITTSVVCQDDFDFHSAFKRWRNKMPKITEKLYKTVLWNLVKLKCMNTKMMYNLKKTCTAV